MSDPNTNLPSGVVGTLEQVAGLGVRRWADPSADQPVVLALHGLTSTSAVWADLATRLPGVPILAPDLPGRGFSLDTPAAPGLPGLAEAVMGVVEALGLRRVLVVGHSMGAFLAPLVVDQLGDRVIATVLADGGVAPEPSRLLQPLVVRALFTVQLRRVVRHWSDVARYTAVAEGGAAANRPDLHPGFRAWSEAVLQPDGDGWRPRLDKRRLVADAVDSLTRPPHLGKLTTSAGPVHLIAAAQGADDGKPAFLSDTAIATGRGVVPRLTSERVQANHATMLFDPAIAAAVQALLRGVSPG
ncbi:MAG TPA: alpha/beta hydrolase [Propionibacteriaceae bacterium]